MASSNSRMRYFDSLRVLAALYIFAGHYVSAYFPEYEYLWEEGQLLCGISGKLALSLFAVLLGYFAAARQRRDQEIPSYILRRYLQFSIPLVLVTGFSAVLWFFQGNASPVQLAMAILEESLLFKSGNLCQPAWCVRDLFYASVIIVLLRGRKHPFWLLGTVTVLALATKHVWIANCLMGSLVFLVNEQLREPDWRKIKKILFHPISKAVLAVVSFVMIRRPIGYVTFILDGISASIVTLLFLNSSLLQRLFSWRPLAALGGISFEFFLLHHPLLPLTHALAQWILGAFCPQPQLFFLSIAFSGVMILGCSWALHRLLNTRLLQLPYRILGL